MQVVVCMCTASTIINSARRDLTPIGREGDGHRKKMWWANAGLFCLAWWRQLTQYGVLECLGRTCIKPSQNFFLLQTDELLTRPLMKHRIGEQHQLSASAILVVGLALSSKHRCREQARLPWVRRWSEPENYHGAYSLVPKSMHVNAWCSVLCSLRAGWLDHAWKEHPLNEHNIPCSFPGNSFGHSNCQDNK